MSVKYDEFLSKIPSEVTEVEVDDELGKAMKQMAIDDFNLNRNETRRHIYMSVLKEKGVTYPTTSILRTMSSIAE